MRGRFAPSPTGYIHLGNVWSALLAWLQVRQAGGTLVLRIEDIDEQRSKPIYTQALMEDLHWLGLNWDEGPDVGGPYGPYIQQERYDRYDAALEKLHKAGLLYPCYCSRARLQAVGAPHAGEHTVYDGHCYGMSEAQRQQMTKKPSWRVHVPARIISFTDGVYGTFHEDLARCCGDFVVRREDLLSSTAQQIWLMETLGYTPPVYTHVPMLVDEYGNRLSKRQHGITIRSLRERGMTAEAILSHLAYAGGLVPERRSYSRDELIRCCDLRKLRKEPIVVKML